MKKIIASFAAFVMVVASLSGLAFAGGTSSTYLPANHNNNLNFNASYNNGAVSMSWNQFVLPGGHNWKYWKVVRATNKEQPVYPDDGYIKYEGNIGFTNYTDTNPPAGTVYYGVCAIHNDSTYKYRDCDWQAVNVGTATNPTPTPTPPVTGISDAMKMAIDNIVTVKFIPKLEAAYPSVDAQITKLEALVSAIDAVIATATAKNKAIFEYLKLSIQNVLDMKKVEALLNI